MGKEIERKFLVIGKEWKKNATGTLIRQGYLNTDKVRTVRVRTYGNKAYVGIKGITVTYTRVEYEYEIPFADATKILDHLAERPLVEKTRYRIPAGEGLVWEIDEFHGDNEGLVVAEIELPSESTKIDLPPWIGKDVSLEPRYFNSNLVLHPYASWPSSDKGT